MAKILSGKEIAEKVKGELLSEIESLKKGGTEPHLAVVLVGEDPASKVYVASKEKMAQELGMRSTVLRMPEETTQQELEAVIDKLNADDTLDGILVQMPLPKHIDSGAVLLRINPDKDVDGLHVVNAGRLTNNVDGFLSCTPAGVMRMLKEADVAIAGANAVVIGRSVLVGKPMAMMLLNANATVTVCHSRTKDLEEHTKNADIVVAAVGIPKFLKGDMLRPGAAVIDVGINRVGKKLTGDVDFESAEPVAGVITPVPGGVGPMTIVMLMENTVKAAKKRAGR